MGQIDNTAIIAVHINFLFLIGFTPACGTDMLDLYALASGHTEYRIGSEGGHGMQRLLWLRIVPSSGCNVQRLKAGGSLSVFGVQADSLFLGGLDS